MNNKFEIGDVVRINLDDHRYDGREGVIVKKTLLDYSSEYYYSVYIHGVIIDVFRPATGEIIGTQSILEPLFENELELIKD